MEEFKVSPELQDLINKAKADQEFKLSPEALAELDRAVQALMNAFNEAFEILVEFAKKIIAEIRRIGIQLARFFLKRQLLEWRVPNKIADYISENIYWYWAARLGWNWFHRKFVL